MTFRPQACYFNFEHGIIKQQNYRRDELSAFSVIAGRGNIIVTDISEYHLAFQYEVSSVPYQLSAEILRRLVLYRKQLYVLS